MVSIFIVQSVVRVRFIGRHRGQERGVVGFEEWRTEGYFGKKLSKVQKTITGKFHGVKFLSYITYISYISSHISNIPQPVVLE